MKARGNTRKLLIAIGEMQDAIGAAKGVAMDDRDSNRIEKLCRNLDDAFAIAVRATSMYEPVVDRTKNDG